MKLTPQPIPEESRMSILSAQNDPGCVAEGDLLWTPSPDRTSNAEITHFLNWLNDTEGLHFETYSDLWDWSVEDQHAFWKAIWQYFDVQSDGAPGSILAGEGIFGARWFEGVKTNYAEHLLRYERRAPQGAPALCHSSETRPVAEMSWQELGGRVRKLATRLRNMGIRPGDCVVSYMPNTPETVIAMIASIAIGAVWASAAPEFGNKTIVDRFGQIEPKLAFFSDGYSFNGKLFDRRDEAEKIIKALPTLEHVVWFDYMGLECPLNIAATLSNYEDLFDGNEIGPDEFRYERVAWDHPLWVLFSSGTTGVPKAIVHSHAGMIVEHLKTMSLHCNLGPSKRMFFYSTTGWMMWNAVVSALITGASAVLYDGSPVNGGLDMLWRMAEETGATCFGASPTLVDSMKKAGIVPGETYDLSAMDMVILGGAPSTPETFKWFYDALKPDIWVTSQSGGTDLCSGLVLGVPILPVYAGEIQCRGLGLAVDVWNEDGESLVNEVGELVVRKPFPSAPLHFWGPAGRQRYWDSYFDVYPGIWRHGDLAKINDRGGVYVYGRSDSTLNRFGVRIGTAEIYRVLERVPAIKDSLIICIETPGGGYYMPLFVSLQEGILLSDELKASISSSLRQDASPRHVPDEIHQVPDIPYTLTGKKMEIPVRKLIMGVAPEKAASRDSMLAPSSFDWFVNFANRSETIQRRS